jgi:hypothetical protein
MRQLTFADPAVNALWLGNRRRDHVTAITGEPFGEKRWTSLATRERTHVVPCDACVTKRRSG